MFLIIGFGEIGCGVKGDPIPPDRPPNLGRGNPTYKRATEDISLPKATGIHFEDPDREQDEEENTEEDEE